MKPSVVLIHGSGGSARRWDHQTSYLSERGYRVLAVDLPGHGRTPGPSSPDIGVYADYVEALLRTEGIEQPVIGGHSMGGGVAITLALRHPDAWSGLVLMSTAARLRLLPTVFDDIRLRFDASIEKMVKAVYSVKVSPQMIEWATSELRELGPATLLDDYRAFEGFDGGIPLWLLARDLTVTVQKNWPARAGDVIEVVTLPDKRVLAHKTLLPGEEGRDQMRRGGKARMVPRRIQGLA